MRLWPCLLVLALCGPSPAATHIDVPVDCQVANIEPGCCLWASLETACYYQKIKAGYGLVLSKTQDPWTIENGEWISPTLGTQLATTNKLRSLGISYRISMRADRNREVIREGLKSGRPVTIGVKSGEPTCGGYHAVLVTAFDEKNGTYTYIDSNLPWCEHRGSMEWFEYVWDGFAVYLK